MTSYFSDIEPITWAIVALGSATIFSVFWILDAQTHKELVKIDITDKELQTHRNILTASFGMEISLVLMFWSPWIMLPLFIACLITRLVHEFIDELHFHTDRCTPYESTLHLGMWISVFTKTSAMFIWGFFSQYGGLLEMPWYIFVWGALVFGAMGITSYFEWKR